MVRMTQMRECEYPPFWACPCQYSAQKHWTGTGSLSLKHQIPPQVVCGCLWTPTPSHSAKIMVANLPPSVVVWRDRSPPSASAGDAKTHRWSKAQGSQGPAPIGFGRCSRTRTIFKACPTDQVKLQGLPKESTKRLSKQFDQRSKGEKTDFVAGWYLAQPLQFV